MYQSWKDSRLFTTDRRFRRCFLPWCGSACLCLFHAIVFNFQLFDVGLDGGDQETDGELLAETEEIPFECGVRHKYPILFDEPITIQANRWYVAWARVTGPSSDCGSSGQAAITSDDQ